MSHDPYKLLETLLNQSYSIPLSVQREYRFDHDRRWRVDFCWPDARLAVEIEGGSWIAGRHTRGQGFINDMEKYNALALRGYCLLRFTPIQAASGEAYIVIEKWFERYQAGEFDR